MGSCAGNDGNLTFDSGSVKVTRAKEKSYAALFKNPRTGKTEYQTTGYHDCFRRNVAMTLMQILQFSRITYMMTWQARFVERVLRYNQIHLARIFWLATQQNISVLPEGSANYMSPFFINFYRGMRLITNAERKKFLM